MAVTINIPSQVKTYANLAAFPASGSLKTIYIAEDTNKTYRWDGSTYVEISASAATGLTVGTTPIASGTNGRVLFQGTGNVLQQSSSLFWDSTNERLGIGTATPSGRFHVKGSVASEIFKAESTIAALYAQFVSSDGACEFGIYTDALYFQPLPSLANGTRFLNGGNTIIMQLAQTGNVGINTTTDAGFRLDVNGTAIFRSNITLNSNALYIGTNSAMTLSTSNSDIILSNGNTNRKIIFNNTVAGQFQFNNGNLLINTTTDDGFRLDVNGTARVQGTLTALGAVDSVIQHTALTNYTGFGGFQLNVSGGSERAFLKLNPQTGEVKIGATGSGYFTTLYAQGVEAMRIFASTRNIGINTTTDAGFRLDVNGTARVDQTLQLNGTGTGTLIAMGGNIGRFVIDGSFIRFKVTGGGDLLNMTTNFFGVNQTSTISSAIMAITSTDRGFLPPRMTTTQKNAIASPSAGLQVFDTTLNQMSYYNGTTWTNI